MPIQTIPELFLAAVRDRPRPDCFSYRDATGQYVAVSSEEAYRRVRALRHGLKSLGVRPGDKVALLSGNRLEWALADLSILCAGAVSVPIYSTLLPDEIGYILNDCQPGVIFVSDMEQAEKIHRLRPELPFLQDVIAFDPVSLPDILPFGKLLQIGQNIVTEHPPEPRDDCVQVDKDDVASIIYTSGTTGRPKGVMLSHWNFVSNVLCALHIVPLSAEDRCLSFLPLSHVLERMGGFFTMIHAGVGIAYAERIDTVPQDMLEIRPTVVISVPRLFEKIYARIMSGATAEPTLKRNIFFWARDVGIRYDRARKAKRRIPAWLKLQFRIADRLVFKKLRQLFGGRLRFFVSGGAPLSPKINEFFDAAGLTILEGYGLTETSPMLTANTFDGSRIGSVGKPVPNTEIRLAEDGEILARGPQVMRGYFRDEEGTREVLSADGWLATGDIGHLDEDGYLFITDRKKELLVTAGGKNVAPQPIENSLRGSKYISQAVLVGDRRSHLSCLLVPNREALQEFAAKREIPQKEVANLIRHPDILALYGRQLEGVNAKLPGFSQIRAFALLEHEFSLEAGELTPTLKVKRRVIYEKYKDMIDGLYPDTLE